MEPTQTLPILDSIELRVMGALMEKSRTTPDYYPMTINALTAACNQKSSRHPVVQYDDEVVIAALNTLKRKGLVATATGGASRSIKYKHNFALVYPVTTPEVAIISLLILRGAQTPGELNTNSGRLYEFESLEEVQETLEKLSAPELTFIMQLPRRAGQKEVRYMHLLGGTPVITEDDEPEYQIVSSSGLEGRIVALETRLADLEEAFNKLMKELNG